MDTPRDESIGKLGDLIKDIRIAMLTTVDATGDLRSRPMATQQIPFDGDLWFFTREDSPKVDEVQDSHQVGLSYADPGHSRYVSVSGWATVVNDPVRKEQLWNPLYQAWFPEGLTDPQLCLLKVTVEAAEYWDGPGSKVVQLLGIAKAVLTRQEYRAGEHEKIELL